MIDLKNLDAGSNPVVHPNILNINNKDGTFYFVETKGRIRENDELKWKSVGDNGYELQVWFINDIKKKEQFYRVVA